MYSRNPHNPYLSVDSPGYGFSEVMGCRGWEKHKRSQKSPKVWENLIFFVIIDLLDLKINNQGHLGKSLLMQFSSMVLAP